MDDVRLIDANALQRVFDKAHEGDPDFYCDNFLNNAGNPSTEWDCVDDILQSAPTIEAQPVKRGKWDREDGEYDSYVLCSECGLNLDVSDYEKQEWREILRFCPSCGADMREVTDADS